MGNKKKIPIKMTFLRRTLYATITWQKVSLCEEDDHHAIVLFRVKIIYFLGLWKRPSLHQFSNNNKKKKQKQPVYYTAGSLVVLPWILSAVSLWIHWPFGWRAKTSKISFCYLEYCSWSSLISQGQTLWSESLYKNNPKKKLVPRSTSKTLSEH